MDASIQPLPHEPLIPQPPPRPGAERGRSQRHKDPGASGSAPSEERSGEEAAAEHETAHPPCEEGVGRRLDVTA